ncbi:MAG: hypothetical protein EXS67_00330 [Candidatus Margulisbacteria bacterium]|nr:hypothetical protein [Candidatus Margulisiibacteriota bacterium]
MAYLLQVSRYIHRNPIEAGIVADATSYQWSSLKDFLEADSPNSNFLKKDFLLSHFKSEAEVSSTSQRMATKLEPKNLFSQSLFNTPHQFESQLRMISTCHWDYSLKN